MQYQEYRGRFLITSSMDAFNVINANGNDINCCINTGRAFVAGFSGEGEHYSLCGKLQGAIRAQCNHSTANVTYAPSTGRVTIAFDHNANIFFGDNALGDALGFSQNVATASTASHTATRQPRYIWRPTRGAADMPVHVNTWWGPRSTSKLSRSIDGTIVSVQGNLLYEGTYSYRNLPRADVIADVDDTDTHRPLEKFWSDVVHPGMEIRVYPDRTASDTNTAYKVGYWATQADAASAIDVGPFAGQIGRGVASYDGLWDVDFAMVKNV